MYMLRYFLTDTGHTHNPAVCEKVFCLSLVHNTTLTMTLDVDIDDDVVPFTIFFRERQETLVSTCLDTRALSAC